MDLEELGAETVQQRNKLPAAAVAGAGRFGLQGDGEQAGLQGLKRTIPLISCGRTSKSDDVRWPRDFGRGSEGEDGSSSSSSSSSSGSSSGEDSSQEDDEDSLSEDGNAGAAAAGGQYLPPEVVAVLGKWLAQHLGRLVERCAAQDAPEFLHPMAVDRLRLEDKCLSGHKRTAATFGMLSAIRACRQTCRAWRDLIRYSSVTQMALDGVLAMAPLCSRSLGMPPPVPIGVHRSSVDAHKEMLWTWWRGHRVIRPPGFHAQHPRQALDGWTDQETQRAATKITRRCPACRTPACQLGTKRPGNPLLYHFVQACGLRHWYKAFTTTLHVQTLGDLHALTESDLRKLGYSISSLDVAIPKILHQIRSTRVRWTDVDIQEQGCHECYAKIFDHSYHVCRHQACSMVYCAACAERRYQDGHPQTPHAILPLGFAKHFPSLRVLSLCDLLLTDLPDQLRECLGLEAVIVANNSLSGTPSWLAQLPNLKHLDLSEQQRGWREGRSTFLQCNRTEPDGPMLHLPAQTLVTLRLCGLSLSAVPLCLHSCALLEELDLSNNSLVITTEQLEQAPSGWSVPGDPWFLGAARPRFTTAGKLHSLRGEINLSAAVWLGTLPHLRSIRLCRAATVVPETELLDAEQRYVDGHIPSTHQSFEQYVVRRWGQQEPEARGSVHVFQSLEQLTSEAHWMSAWGGEISFG